MKKKTIKVPLYSGNLVIIQADKKENLNDIKKKYDLKEDPSNRCKAVAFVEEKKTTEYTIAFNNITTPSFIAHESLHVLNYIYQDHGIIYDIINDEPAAYLLGWIVKQCHKFLKIQY